MLLYLKILTFKRSEILLYKCAQNSKKKTYSIVIIVYM